MVGVFVFLLFYVLRHIHHRKISNLIFTDLIKKIIIRKER